MSESILAPHCILIKPGAYQRGDQTTHIRVTTPDLSDIEYFRNTCHTLDLTTIKQIKSFAASSAAN